MGSALAIAPLAPLMPPPSGEADLHQLQRFDAVPHRHDVAVLEGMVAVYDPDAISREGLVEGGFYVVENQRPMSGMSWESFLRLEADRRPGSPRGRLQTERYVVQAVQLERTPGYWWFRLSSGFHDGPIPEWCAGYNFVGKVVGLYAPLTSGRAS